LSPATDFNVACFSVSPEASIMMIWILSWFALAAQVADANLREQYPWYKTGDEIHDELKDLSMNCPAADFELSTRSAVNSGENAGQQVNLDVVRVSKKGSPGEKKAFFVFGEHARELISPETALQFLKTLCGQGGGRQRDLAERVLASTSFVIMPNVNPVARKRVEGGEYCKRTNEDAVDLNRNWGDKHRDSKRANTDDEMNPGSYGFSEPEAQVMRDAVAEEKPDIFLSVHSGAYFMGTPFGYTDTREPSNEDDMTSLLGPISQKYCGGGCPYGGLAGMIGYKSIGCDIDYVKEELKVPYAFTWEIYIGADARKFYIEKAHASAENRDMNDEASQFFYANGLNLLQDKASTRRFRSHAHAMGPESAEKGSDCFEQFNPESQSETEDVTENWSGAFLMLCDEVANRGKTSSSPASKPDGGSQVSTGGSPAVAQDGSYAMFLPKHESPADTGGSSMTNTSAASASDASPVVAKDGSYPMFVPTDVTPVDAGGSSMTNASADSASDGSSKPGTDPVPKIGFLASVDSLKEFLLSEKKPKW